MASRKLKLAECERYPHVKQKWMEVCEYFFDKYKERCKNESPEDMFEWWISGKSLAQFNAEKLFKLDIL